MRSMTDINRQMTAPLKFPRTRRNRMLQNMTSCTVGKMVPIAYVPLLREDSIKSGRMRISFRMDETEEILMNPVKVRVNAFLVSHLCDPRFEKSMDQLNRSYAGEPQIEGGDVIPFIQTHEYGTFGSKAVYKTLGLHAPAAKQVNMFPLKAYNLVWNYMAENVSESLTPRELDDASLAPAFWRHGKFAHIKPTFDAALMEGEVALTVRDTVLDVKGIGIYDQSNPPVTVSMHETGEAGAEVTQGWNIEGYSTAVGAGKAHLVVKRAPSSLAPVITAELAADNFTLSLANLEMAKQTRAFAAARQQFDGHDDDWIVDNYLMNGLEIPDLAMAQPYHLATGETVFAQSLRYASDAGNLDETATNGATFVDLRIRWPKGQRLHAGGVIMIVAEIVPEQLWERQADPYFHSVDVSEWPEALRDTLDPQKVEEVFNYQIDTAHATPNAVFGYGPMNWEWDMRMAQIGGRFAAPAADGTFDEDRQRFWAMEVVNPTLAASFYVVQTPHQNPFLNGGTVGALVDVFDITTLGNVVIEGNTQFGPALIEATGNWDAVEGQQQEERINPPGA